jgi:phosphatidylserine decarboxylase
MTPANRSVHQYVERQTNRIRTEELIADGIINRIYSDERENNSFLFKLLSSKRVSALLGLVNYDLPLGERLTGARRVVKSLGIDLEECLDEPADLNSPRKIFERRIRYWETRPLPEDRRIVVAPADAKMLVGSFSECTNLFIKEKFFVFEELLGLDQSRWLTAFSGGDFAILRLTPEKYHYNHTPVTGIVMDFYEIPGRYHSCNPGAVVSMVTPFSKNRRVVTVLDTDVPGGSNVGLVAMIEIVALMIGDIRQCYSDHGYAEPRDISRGMLLKRGQPKSLFRPGSSVDMLLFQPKRITFSRDIVANLHRQGIQSRFSRNFGRPLVETEVQVRSAIARPYVG